jgi:hypothetical protein
MKAFLFIVSFLTSISMYAQRYKITIKITETESFCGGMQPTEEMLQDLRAPKPMLNTSFYLVKGIMNKKGIKVIKKLETNNKGIIKLNLSKGNYAILSESQVKEFIPKKNDEYHIWDNACLEKLWKTPLLILRVKKSFQTKANVHKPCSYNQDCLTYKGPLPS